MTTTHDSVEPLSPTRVSADLLSLPVGVPPGVMVILPTALGLIDQCFCGIRGITASMDADPEAGDEWLTLHIALENASFNAHGGYDQFVKRWVAAVPFPDHHLIHLAFEPT